MPEERLVLLRLVLIVALGGAAQWLAWRLRLPSILLLLAAGFLAGPATGWLDPDATFGHMLLPVVSLSVAVILFEGGLTLSFRELRSITGVLRRLVTTGALATWIVAAAAAHYLVGLDAGLAVLAGAVLIVTGPTVILPLLRHIRPTGSVAALLKWEGIVIDPVGALVTVLTFEVLLAGGQDAPRLVAWALLKTLVVGGGLGLLAAGVLVVAVARYWVPEFLHNAVALLLVCLAFAGANLAQAESGLLAVTVMGVALANQRFADLRHVREFKENLRVFLISALFIVLAARLRVADLAALGWRGPALVVVLILVARPLCVLVSTAGSKLRAPERLFLAWVAPRGIVAAAVASVLALQLELAGYAEARLLVPLTLTAIVGTVLVYGLTAGPLAQRLGLAEANPQGVLIIGAHRLAREFALLLRQQRVRVLLVDTNRAEVAAARMADLPVCHGNVLSEQTFEELDLGGLGRLCALTPNDEVNVLAVQRFAPLFGRAAVYQLPPGDGKQGRAAMDKHLHGRWLFSPSASGASLFTRLASGAVLKATKLTEAFDFAAFRTRYGPDFVVLAIVGENGRLTLRTADDASTPRAGQTIVALVAEPAPATTMTTAPTSATTTAAPTSTTAATAPVTPTPAAPATTTPADPFSK